MFFWLNLSPIWHNNFTQINQILLNDSNQDLSNFQWLIIMFLLVFIPALILSLTFYKKFRKNKKLKKIDKDAIKPSIK